MGDEIAAMAAINQAVDGLDADELGRVLRWAQDKFGDSRLLVGPSAGVSVGIPAALTANTTDGGIGLAGSYQRISDLMDAAGPRTTVDHVLVASYWFQVLQGAESFGSQDVNNELKDLGRASKNITDSYTTMMKRKPPFVRQVQKAGSTKQARKRYRLTVEGIRRVERMLSGETED